MPGRFRVYALRRVAASLFALALFAGMLFWTKLRLVSDIPRQAYAVPKEQSTPGTSAAAAPSDADGAAQDNTAPDAAPDPAQAADPGEPATDESDRNGNVDADG